MTRDPGGSDLDAEKYDDVLMASEKEEAEEAAREGADLERLLSGEDPESDSLTEARHWVTVYGHLVNLEQQLFDLLAELIPSMPREAQREAEDTNLPVLATQLERFRHRLDYWVRREQELREQRQQGAEG